MEKNFKLLSEGIVLAAIPAIGYWIAYMYEIGYCNFYNLPNLFIEIPVNSVLKNSLSVAGGLVVFLFVLDLIKQILEGVTDAVKYSFYKIIFMYFLIFGYGLIFEVPNEELRIAILVFISPIFIKDLLWPIWSQRHIKGFGNRVSKAKKRDFEFDSLTDKFAKISGPLPFLLLIFFCIVSIFSYYAGAYSANTQQEFFVTKSKPDHVLIRKYGDNWLALKTDRKALNFEQSYEIISANEVKSLARLKLGKIRPAPTNEDEKNTHEIVKSEQNNPE